MGTETPAWKSERTKFAGTVYRNGVWTILKTERAYRPWFVTRKFMMLCDKRRNVRNFGSLDAAKRAAEKAMKLPFKQLKPFLR
jgi:hypothetical protein